LELEQRAVEALNSLAGCDDLVGQIDGGKARAASAAHVHSACTSIGRCPEEETSARAAFEALRGCGLYAPEESGVAPFDESLVSLPEALSSAVPLARLLGSGGDKIVEDFCASSVLPAGEVSENLSDAPSVPYIDPRLKHDKNKYARFIRRLYDAGMVEYRAIVREQVGVFACVKRTVGCA